MCWQNNSRLQLIYRSKAGICTDKKSAESKEQTESEESQQAIGLYDLPNKTSVCMWNKHNNIIIVIAILTSS